jgi:hypothetical protein
VLGDLFVGFTRAEIVGWTLPDLQRVPKEGVISEQLEPRDVTTSFRLAYPSPTQPPIFFRVITPSRWYMTKMSATVSLFFDLAIESGVPRIRTYSSFQRFQLTVDPENASRSTLTFLSQAIVRWRFVGRASAKELPHSVSFGHSSMLMLSATNWSLDLDKVVYSSAAATGNGDWNVVSLRRTKHSMQDCSALCPSSGRLAYYCSERCDRHPEGGLSERIRMIDCL